MKKLMILSCFILSSATEVQAYGPPDVPMNLERCSQRWNRSKPHCIRENAMKSAEAEILLQRGREHYRSPWSRNVPPRGHENRQQNNNSQRGGY
jgi:hypothetical protein